MNLERILVIDDNPDVVTIVGQLLKQAGYEVWTAISAIEALQLIARQGLPHLAIVDISMPVMDGFEFSRRVREFSDLPIIMLTAQSQEKTVIEALDEFADDYIIKPFVSKEVLVRVERVLRRVRDFDYTQQATIQVDRHLQVDFALHQITVDGQTVDLTPTESQLLNMLLRRPGRLVHGQVITDTLWPDEAMPEERLRVHISRLRSKINPGKKKRNYIVTVRGKGYYFQVNDNGS